MQSIPRAELKLITRTHNLSRTHWIQAGRYKLPLLSYLGDFVVSAAIEKRHLFYFFCTSAVLRPDSLSRHTWCEWWQSESLHRACLSWCVGVVAVLVGPRCREVAAICVQHYSLVLPLKRWNVFLIVRVTTTSSSACTHLFLLLSSCLLLSVCFGVVTCSYATLQCDAIVFCFLYTVYIHFSFESLLVLISPILFRMIS